jgi:hypothetical protein
VYSHQDWFYLKASASSDGMGRQHNDTRFRVSYCERCSKSTIWLGENIIYPLSSTIEPPNIDLPVDIKQDYAESASILGLSPRGSAALLRLCIQKLCQHLGETGKDINSDIKNLVAKGLPPKVQEALDSVRVIGNEAVHPGTIDLRDNREIAVKLFKLVNFVATKLISDPKEIDEIYGLLPPEKLEGIKKRDET